MKDFRGSDTPDQGTSPKLPRPKPPNLKKTNPAPPMVTNPAENGDSLQFQPEHLIQGVIWAEILGKPKAKRSRR